MPERRGQIALGGIPTRDCNIQFQQQQGGNNNLKPENSKAWTVGGGWQPTAATTVGAGLLELQGFDSIGPTGEEVIFGNPTLYRRTVHTLRHAVGGGCGQALECLRRATSPNTLAYIINGQLNLGNYKTSGIDFTATWQGGATTYGRFSAGYRGTYVLNYEYQLEKDAVYNDNLGIYFNGNPVAKYRQVMNFGWQYGPWSTQLVQRYLERVHGPEHGRERNPRHVSSYNTWDLAVTWTGPRA